MKQRKSEINWKLVVRVACLMLLDVMLLYLACLLALLSRFDLSIHTLMRDSSFLPALHAAFPWMAIGMITLFIPLKLYSSLWEFAGVEELLHILCACFLFAAATLLLILFGVLDLPRSFPVLAGLYLVALLSASRFSYRLIRTILHRSGSEKRKKRTMLIGAGSAGMLVLREFQTSENSQNNVVCVIDDDRDKLLAEAARKVSEDAPADWLFNYRVTTAYAKGVTGFPINLNQTLLPLYNVAYTK